MLNVIKYRVVSRYFAYFSPITGRRLQMPYTNELDFLCKTLKKCHIQVIFADTDRLLNEILEEPIRSLFAENRNTQMPFGTFFEREKPQTVWLLNNFMGQSYLFFRLPHRTKEPVFVMGPFLPEAVDKQRLLEYSEKYGIPPGKLKLFSEYFESIPVVSANNPVFALLDTFWEKIWNGRGFSMIDIDREWTGDVMVLSRRTADEANDIALSMEIMERRYAYENELMRAVEQGHVHKLPSVLESFSETMFEKRLTDPIRNCKNYCIIMNTLLRKAAESGGVHPLYLHDISSSFAIRIEQIASISAVKELMAEMFRGYCRLVRKHSMKTYSSTVQKVIARIDSDLSADLSLVSLANQQNISPGYLSTVFKKETGKTITEYIIGERIHLAMHLLRTTRLQIQTVALHCGIADVQYFSKIFKKHVGMTPKEYRKSVH